MRTSIFLMNSVVKPSGILWFLTFSLIYVIWSSVFLFFLLHLFQWTHYGSDSIANSFILLNSINWPRLDYSFLVWSPFSLCYVNWLVFQFFTDILRHIGYSEVAMTACHPEGSIAAAVKDAELLSGKLFSHRKKGFPGCYASFAGEPKLLKFTGDFGNFLERRNVCLLRKQTYQALVLELSFCLLWRAWVEIGSLCQ